MRRTIPCLRCADPRPSRRIYDELDDPSPSRIMCSVEKNVIITQILLLDRKNFTWDPIIIPLWLPHLPGQPLNTPTGGASEGAMWLCTSCGSRACEHRQSPRALLLSVLWILKMSNFSQIRRRNSNVVFTLNYSDDAHWIWRNIDDYYNNLITSNYWI